MTAIVVASGASGSMVIGFRVITSLTFIVSSQRASLDSRERQPSLDSIGAPVSELLRPDGQDRVGGGVPGYWGWTHAGYVWVPGRYAVPPAPAYVWMPGYWAPTITGHIWIGGHWPIAGRCW